MIFEKGKIYHSVVEHDDTCNFFKTNKVADCNCVPTESIMDNDTFIKKYPHLPLTKALKAQQ